jgi:hypothetical protein
MVRLLIVQEDPKRATMPSDEMQTGMSFFFPLFDRESPSAKVSELREFLLDSL